MRYSKFEVGYEKKKIYKMRFSKRTTYKFNKTLGEKKPLEEDPEEDC